MYYYTSDQHTCAIGSDDCSEVFERPYSLAASIGFEVLQLNTHQPAHATGLSIGIVITHAACAACVQQSIKIGAKVGEFIFIEREA
jgi:hypothetical protein